MSSVTEVAVPTSDFDGNAPANGSRDMASTFSESLYWRRSARRYELLGLVSCHASRVVVRGFSGDSACREESASAGIRFGAGGLRPGLCGLLVRP